MSSGIPAAGERGPSIETLVRAGVINSLLYLALNRPGTAAEAVRMSCPSDSWPTPCPYP